MEMKILEVLTLLSASDDELDENSKELKKEIKEKAVLRTKESEKIQKAKTEVPFSKFKAYLKELNEEEKFIRYQEHYNKAIEIAVKGLYDDAYKYTPNLLSDLEYELQRAQMLEDEIEKLKRTENV